MTRHKRLAAVLGSILALAAFVGLAPPASASSWYTQLTNSACTWKVTAPPAWPSLVHVGRYGSHIMWYARTESCPLTHVTMMGITVSNDNQSSFGNLLSAAPNYNIGVTVWRDHYYYVKLYEYSNCNTDGRWKWTQVGYVYLHGVA